VRLEINADAAIAAFEQHPGKNPAEKTGPAGDQNCEHVSSEYYVLMIGLLIWESKLRISANRPEIAEAANVSGAGGNVTNAGKLCAQQIEQF
jgi:hypothetical protein